jgi:tetratricopeptide (TPR) repeat protein
MTSRTRLMLFRFILVLSPLVLLLLIELGLRGTGLWAPEPLIIDVPGSDGAMRGFNVHAGRRYFSEGQTAVPMLTPEVFPRTKSPKTFRVLCLGESSTAGFPFDCQVPFPWQLKRILSEAYPDRTIEVLNAGMSAISSHVIVDMLPDLLETGPDLVLVYTGHNEFYGVYGGSSALSMGGNDLLVRASLAVQRTHIGQMMRRAVDAFRPAPPESTASQALMQRVVGDQNIPPGSPRYVRTMEGFRANLGRIADACAERKIPVLFATLVSNERDLPPFAGTGADAPPQVSELLATGDRARMAGDVSRAAEAYADVLKFDPANADALYGSGRLLLLAGNAEEARRHFREARDNDRMRFRASSEANAIIASVAKNKGAWLVDFADILAARSPAHSIGREWICDHLHPDTRGYYMLAAAFYVGIQRMHILPAPDPGFRMRQDPYGVTPLDRAIGLLKVAAIMHHWPFKPLTTPSDTVLARMDTSCLRIAEDYISVRNVWTKAHADMATSWLNRGDREAARKEYEAVAMFVPDDPWPYRMLAETYRQEQQWRRCADALEEALRRSRQQGMVLYDLGLARMNAGDTRAAIEAMAGAAQAPEFNADERANARFHLAGLLSDEHRIADAIGVLKVLLAELPTYQPARILLNRLEGSQR